MEAAAGVVSLRRRRHVAGRRRAVPQARAVGAAAVVVAMAVACAAVHLAPVDADATDAPRRGHRTLALVDDLRVAASHSRFFGQLTDRGHSVDFRLATDSDVPFAQFGEYNYDNVVLMAPGLEEFGNVDLLALVQFVDAGGNLIVAADRDVGEPLRDLAAECGIEFDADGTAVMDHMQYDASDPAGDHTLVLATDYIRVSHIVGDLASGSGAAPTLFRGVGMAVDDDNVLAARILTASPSGYSADATQRIKEYPESAASETLLVVAMQARNNARTTFFGSTYMLSDAAFEAVVTPAPSALAAYGGLAGAAGKASANAYFADQVGRWTFQEQGVLRARDVTHTRADGSAAASQIQPRDKPNMPTSMYPDPEVAPNSLVYRIKDELRYSVTVEQYDADAGAWVPFAADDMQLEFVMLDPYVRTTMSHNGAGQFTAEFRAPDVYGIFKFRVMYRRTGLSTLELSTQVSVRPFRHDEYERFIPQAFPYYASALAMLVAFFAFTVSALLSDDRRRAGDGGAPKGDKK